MKILIITDLYPIDESEETTPRTIKDFADGWKAAGHEVRIIRPNFILNSFIRKKKLYRSGIYGNLENLNYFLPFTGDITKKIKTEFEPDITIAHMPSGVIFANKLKRPFIAAVHVSDLEVLTNPVYAVYFKQELEKAYKNALKIACRSYAIQTKFLKLYPEYKDKTFVCYSGINCEIVKRNWSGKAKILTCANLIKRKNVDKVIDECIKYGLNLTVIGDGAEFKYLKRSTAGKQGITFAGRLTHEKVLEEMRKADIFALPSINETFGMVYLEAMASGCITICTENDGIAGIIDNGINGFFWKDGILKDIINSKKQNEILNNTYETILNYTQTKACANYLEKIF